jgi:hypothetical protein
MFRFIIILSILFALSSCSKNELNERKLGGVWEGEKVVYTFYQNNEVLRDSTVPNSGALYLWDDDELYNQYGSSLAISPDFTGSEWEGDAGDINTLLGYNISKHTRRKLELTRNYTDNDLNVISSVTFYFKRSK